MPILNAMENYRIRRYSNHNSRLMRRSGNSAHQSLAVPLTMVDGTSCGLCLEEFRSSETVLDCLSGHIFHEACFAKQKAHAVQNVCPSCG
mmetsp:Transcript_15056/g.20449  ORF Transcript_15056/g.20449 Transcript_15056/m.20449 type:complete len:90 (-) Transcript_15056:301-570(-)